LPLTKKDWVLTGDAFDRLLLYLDQDREQAAGKYEDLRQMLITFFEFRGLADPDHLADETSNRIARRLSEGEQIDVRPSTYFYAVARNVWREQIAKPGKAGPSINDLPAGVLARDSRALSADAAMRASRERRLDCLEQCLAELPAESRELIMTYYGGEQLSRIQSRKDLAERLGIQPNALRIRVCRLRDKLERCVRNRLQHLAEG
jgi:RNA polymerase sigma factor (sigma-70 family)